MVETGLRESSNAYAKTNAHVVEAALKRYERALNEVRPAATTDAMKSCWHTSRLELEALISLLRLYHESAVRAVAAATLGEMRGRACSYPTTQAAYAGLSSVGLTMGVPELARARAARGLGLAEVSCAAAKSFAVKAPNDGMAHLWLRVSCAEQASEPLRRAVERFERAGAWAHVALALGAHHRGQSLAEQVTAAAKAVEVAKKHVRETNPLLSLVLYRYGRLLLRDGDAEGATVPLREALSLAERTMGESNHWTGRVLFALANAETKSGNWQPADEAWNRSRAILEPLMGEQHPSVLALRTLALAPMSKVRPNEVTESEAKSTLEAVVAVHGEESVEAARVRVRLGMLQNELGKHKDAEANLNAAALFVSPEGEATQDHSVYAALARARIALEDWDGAAESVSIARNRLRGRRETQFWKDIEQLRAHIEARRAETPPDCSTEDGEPRRGLPQQVLDNVVHADGKAIGSCFRAGRKRHPDRTGRVLARFVIAEDGTVGSVNTEGSDFPDQEVVACVGSELSSLVFPKSGCGKTRIVRPLIFNCCGKRSQH